MKKQLSDLKKLSEKFHLKSDELTNLTKDFSNKFIEAQNTIQELLRQLQVKRKQRNLEIDTINRRLDRLENQ